ncbi:MAG: CoA transferase [Deltaproteobacteria bacterium]|nr:CoA transferase [Deltaproteobacteria bacterium]
MPKPLEGIRVLDWTIWQQGPVSTMMLGDLGAEVIKLEERVGGDPGRGVMSIGGASTSAAGQKNYYFEANNRHKKSLTLNLKTPEAREIVYKLVEKSDVFVQNFRKGVAGKLGLGYEALSKYNPKLIYASATGYGPEGPDSGEPSFDYMGLARSGIMNAIGEPNMEPMNIAGGIADQMGAIMLAYGVITALFARERFGVGQEVDTSHLGSMMMLQGLNLSSRLILGKEFRRAYRTKAPNPLWNHYKCSDGQWVCLAMIQADRYWPDFCKALGIKELEKDERFANMAIRTKNAEALIAVLDQRFASKSRDEWMSILKHGGDFIYTRVNTINDLPEDPQMLANDYVVPYDHPTWGNVNIVGVPVRLSKTPGDPRGAAPEFGEHTEQILVDMLGYSWEDVGRMKEKEVI